MLRWLAPTLATLLLLNGAAGARADDEPDKVAEQKKAALERWGLLELGGAAHQETAHLLVYAPKDLEKRLKEIAALLEKHYETAAKPLQVDPKDNRWWPGKLTVYLFSEREQFTTFVRRVEKRRLESDEVGSYRAEGDQPHAAAGPPRTKQDPSLELQAGQQVAAAMLQRKAGAKVPLPYWLVAGFGRATNYRAAPGTYVTSERSHAARQVQAGRGVKDVWGGGLGEEDAGPLRASLADYLAYGPGAAKFPMLLTGFEPEEGQEKKTTEQALDAVGLKWDTLEKAWKAWRPR
jgi:hypothetical protein